MALREASAESGELFGLLGSDNAVQGLLADGHESVCQRHAAHLTKSLIVYANRELTLVDAYLGLSEDKENFSERDNHCDARSRQEENGL
jgi:hypothetical protein